MKETLEYGNRGGGNYRGGFRGGYNPRRGNNERPYVPREQRDPNSNYRGKRPYIPRDQRENREGESNDFEYSKKPYIPREDGFRGRRPFRGGRGSRFHKGPRREDDGENQNETHYHNHKTDYNRFKGEGREFGDKPNYKNNINDDFKNNNTSYKAKNNGYNIPISNIDKVDSKIQQEKFGNQENDIRFNNNFEENLQKPVFKGKINSDFDRKENIQNYEQPGLNEQRNRGGDVSN